MPGVFSFSQTGAMGERLEGARDRWRRMKGTSSFHNVMLFLGFVVISAVFWFILALNDSVQDSFNVNIHISNVPDSVTFITDIPEKMHVSVRDRGSSLWRNGLLRKPTIHINFREYADRGVLRYSKNDLLSSLKGVFGTSAQITSMSMDSLRLVYTDNKGKRVPIVVSAAIYPAIGSTIEGTVKAVPSSVLVFGDKGAVDSIHRVVTNHLELTDLSETTEVKVGLRRIPNVRIIPSEVVVKVPVEPLVRKEALISLTPVNVPAGESLLLFPSKVPVEYYVAMSRLGDDDDDDIELHVDFKDIATSRNGKLHVEVIHYPERLMNLSLKADSVEYTIVKN